MDATMVKGYKEISLPELQSELQKSYKASGKSYVELAYEMNLKSISTVTNLLSSEDQIVSDEMLTRFINLLGLKAFVQWQNGTRTYYIKN